MLCIDEVLLHRTVVLASWLEVRQCLAATTPLLLLLLLLQVGGCAHAAHHAWRLPHWPGHSPAALPRVQRLTEPHHRHFLQYSGLQIWCALTT
jgi:hypothetical protein